MNIAQEGDRHVTKLVGIAILACIAVLGCAVLYVGAGAYDVGADTPHWEMTRKVMEVIRDRSIAARANQIELPDLQDEAMVLKGAGQYASMCVNCHLAPEQSDSEIRPGLYPKPPNLSEQRIDPKTAFWVIKHGLKMTGMPAWGLGHDDATIWSIVAFVTRLPGLSAEHYKDPVARAPPDEEMESMKKGDDQKQGERREARLRDADRTKRWSQALIGALDCWQKVGGDSRMDEHRSIPRHRVLKAATISFGGGTISCTVRNLSDSGASLEVASQSEFLMHSFWRPHFCSAVSAAIARL
jgi:mono/diheme cytochrome c family protein